MSNKMALDALTAIADGQVMGDGKFSHVDVILAYQGIARAAIAALQAEPQGWRPIETAPENTQVAALFRGERPVIAHKNVPHDIPSGWCHEFAGGHYFDHPTRGLTHWMPLPATPPKD